MMSVLIKGMEMPISCSDCFAERCIGSDFGCDILGFDDANTTCFTRERRKDCPLIAVPPHGRLIDADATLKLLRNLGSRDYRREKGTIMDAMKMLSFDEYTPTIIPAEEGE